MKKILISMLVLSSFSSYSTELDCSLRLDLDIATYGYVQEKIKNILTNKGYVIETSAQAKYILSGKSSTLNSSNPNRSEHAFFETITNNETRKIDYNNDKVLTWNASLFDINWDKQAIKRIQKIDDCIDLEGNRNL
jgi:hypothetical protein